MQKYNSKIKILLFFPTLRSGSRLYVGTLFFVLFTFSFLILTLHKANAQAEIPLTLTNARNEANLDPGEQHRFTMKLYNRGKEPVVGNVKIVDFIVKDNKGTPVFLENPESTNTLSNKYSAASWMSIPYERLAIPAEDKVTFDITVNVPSDARPGGHYAALIYEVTSDFIENKETANQESATAIAPRIAGLVYIAVSGDVREQALLTQLKAPSFSEYGPIKVASEITNKGDSHISPQGFLTVYDWFGRVVTQTKLDEVNIFPEVARAYENKVGEHLMIGRYKINLSATYGTANKILEGYAYFWVVPWKMIVVIALTLAILLVLFNNWKKGGSAHQKELETKLKEEEKELEELKEQLKKK